MVVPQGYTQQFLDGEVTSAGQVAAIRRAFDNVARTNDFTVVEGAGHVGVGSIVKMNNAQVASLLDLDMVLVVNGGIGKSVRVRRRALHSGARLAHTRSTPERAPKSLYYSSATVSRAVLTAAPFLSSTPLFVASIGVRLLFNDVVVTI